jgi:hypothetical protein
MKEKGKNSITKYSSNLFQHNLSIWKIKSLGMFIMIDDSLIINTFVLFFLILNNKHICVIGSNYRHTPYLILYYIISAYLYLSLSFFIFYNLHIFLIKERTPYVFDTKYFYANFFFFPTLKCILVMWQSYIKEK